MKKNFKYLLPIILLGFMLVLPVAEIFAQGPPCCPFPPQVTTCGGLPPCTPVPLDGGLSALLLAGVAIGAKKVMGKSKV